MFFFAEDPVLFFAEDTAVPWYAVRGTTCFKFGYMFNNPFLLQTIIAYCPV